ncbi:MAG: hypothetical protein P8M70_12235, partial [Verrucomicrobiota bacterium]|nr:hypothetical protein [Verrucomicrobiota bacterium]
MKQILLICAAVALVGCHAGNKKNASKAKAIAEHEAAVEAKAVTDAKVIEAAIRAVIGKSTGELTKADLEKVIVLKLINNQLTDVTSLEKLT